MKPFNLIGIILVIFLGMSLSFKKKKILNADNKKLYVMNAVIVKDKNTNVIPKLRKFNLEITEEKLNFIPVSLDQLQISVKYSTFIFIDGEIIFTLELLKEMKNKYYSKISENVKYQLRKIEIESDLDAKKTFIIIIKQLLNESMFEFKFLLFTMDGKENENEKSQQELLDSINQNYLNELSNRDATNLVSGENFCELNLQIFQPEEHLSLFYWSDYIQANKLPNSNFFYTFLTNEGIVMTSRSIEDVTNNVKYTFRYDQIVDCEGISSPEKFQYITSNLDENILADISDLKCCVAYNTIWNTHYSNKELFCSRYDSFNQCKPEISIFAQTIFSKCVFSGISILLDILTKNGYNLEVTLAHFSDLEKIKYFSLLKNIKKYKIYPINQPETDNRQLRYDFSTDCFHNFKGLECKLTELNQNLGQILNKFEDNLKELDVDRILNNIVKHNDIDRGELKEKVMENIRLHNNNVILSKYLCECINRLVYVEDMVPILVEMVNRNLPFPVEIAENILTKNENSPEFKKSDLIQIKSTIIQLLDTSKLEELQDKNYTDLENSKNKEQLVEKIIIDPEEEQRRLESLKNIEKTYNTNDNPLKFLYSSYKTRQEKERIMPINKKEAPNCKIQNSLNARRNLKPTTGIVKAVQNINNLRETTSNDPAYIVGNINSQSSMTSEYSPVNGHDRLSKQIYSGIGNPQINKLSRDNIVKNNDSISLKSDANPYLRDYKTVNNVHAEHSNSNVDNLINFRKRIFLGNKSDSKSNNSHTI